MFTEARTKLTLYYLLIIMAISIFFSLIIYRGATNEFRRMETVQRLRRPPPAAYVIEPDIVHETETRIAFSLFYINLIIFVIAGVGGYFLAGKTLDPISNMVDEQKEFVGNASHELRTPLTSLKTAIEVALRDKNLNLIQAKKLLISNLEDVNKMQKLSNYLLELNRYESGKEIPMTNVDLKNIVLKVVGKTKVKTDLKKSVVVANEDAVTELVTILLDNALKYSGKNKNVEIRTKSGGILEVEDKGIGISKEDLPHIFDRFYRSDKSTTKNAYGLGLSIAKSIVELHKGTIEVESKLGKGTLFRVVI